MQKLHKAHKLAETYFIRFTSVHTVSVICFSYSGVSPNANIYGFILSPTHFLLKGFFSSIAGLIKTKHIIMFFQ